MLARLPEDEQPPASSWQLPEDPLPCWADRDRLAEVLENLISNAVKYSPEGGAIARRASQRERRAW